MQVFASKIKGGVSVFEDIEKNKVMILGAYKKLKSYYYYDKTILYNKMRLATWEHPTNDMRRRVDDLAAFLLSLESNIDTSYLSMLTKQIALIPMPKSFAESGQSNELLTNIIPNNRQLNKINFYIKAPVEILILDTIWSLMISKIAHDQGSIRPDVYANRIKTKQVFNSSYDLFKGIDFSSNRLFYPYFRQYSSWRNNAFQNIQNRHILKKDSILISLDIKSYYYSVTFDFNNLPLYLNNDTRLNSIASLTSIIKSIHVSYTAEMQKFRGSIPADCSKEQSAFPIGLVSSMILSNLYLKDFDSAIHEKLKPSYYGRYVDDILFVIDKTDDMEISPTSIIEKTLIKHDIVESRGNSYRLLAPKGELSLQKGKIRCIYFDHNEPDAMIKLLCESSNLKPSMSDGFLMPDIDLAAKNFDDSAYSIGQDSGTIKVRNFLFSANNYKASLFLNDLIRASKNVNVHDESHANYMDRQLSQIVRFYSFQQSIEYRSAWTNIFNLILINERYDYFLRFYDRTYKAIESISSNLVESIVPSKLEHILVRLKEALKEQLSISASIAIAPHSIKTVKEQISQLSNLSDEPTVFFVDSDKVFSNAQDIRNANMFNHHLLAYPLLSYLERVDCDTSLINICPHNLEAIFSSKKLDRDKTYFSPKFIHLDELYLWWFMISYYSGGNPFQGKIPDINRQFSDINQIDATLQTISESQIPLNTNDYLQYIKVTDSSEERKVKTALASIYLDEHDDVIPVLENPDFDLSPKKKGMLYKMLNEAKDKEAKLIVFPEFFMPIQWLQEILVFARKNKIAILSGLRYLVNGNQAYNYILVLQPFSSDRFKYALPLFREKNFYAPAEKIELARKQLHCKDPLQKSTHLISWNGLTYSNLMCYELTNIEYRYKLRGLIDLLIVPELNRDTNYFSNMVEATTRDLHAFVIQVNTSKYGDSRITGPYNSFYKDIIKLKGGEDNIILTGTIDADELSNKRDTYLQSLQAQITEAFSGKLKEPHDEKRKPKDPVAGYKKGGA